MNHYIVLLCYLFSFTSIFSQKQDNTTVKKRNTPTERIKSNDWTPLLDKDLSQWEIWTGVPHQSVKGLPKSYEIPADGKPVAPLGLDNSMNVFSTSIDSNKEVVLNISGLIYGGLTTKKDYENYHLTMLFKWGEKKYEPRLEKKRDSGLLYHCYGDHGAFWDVWKKCIELQIQEGDFGDLYKLAKTTCKANITVIDKVNRWDPKGTPSHHAKRSTDEESSHGNWTRVDLYTIGDKAVHVVNGKVVLAVYDMVTHEKKKLTAGQIQIQSEGAEAYVKEMYIRPLKEFPKQIYKAAGY